MTSRQYLNGQVHLTTLPAVRPGDVEQPLLKRLWLPQGCLAQVYDGDEGIRYLAWIELTAGSVRGNHVHRRKQEYFYLIAGSVALSLEDPSTGERAELVLAAGDLVWVAAGIAHAYLPLADGQAIEFSPVRFDPADTRPHEINPARR